MTNTQKEEITPDQLLDMFHGPSMKKIILFTLVVHVVVLIVSSVPFLWKLVAGADSSQLSEKERMEMATREATSSLRDIASKHGLKPEELSSQFGNSTPAAPKAATQKPAAETPEVAPPTEPEKPKSEIEKQLEIKEKGPQLPAIEDEKEDLFK